MSRAPWTAVACLASLAFPVISNPLSAQEFRSDSGRFRFQIPQNWVRLDGMKAAQVKNGLLRNPTTIFHEGFEPRNFQQAALQKGAVILVVEERGKMGGLTTYDQIDRSLQNEFRQGFQRGAGPNVTLGNIVLDRAKNRFVGQFDTQEPNGVKVRGVLFGFLGKQGVVMVLGMAVDWDFRQHSPTFDTLADSFQFDPGSQFVPFDATIVLWIVGGIFGSLCCIVAFAAIVIGVIIMMTVKSA